MQDVQLKSRKVAITRQGFGFFLSRAHNEGNKFVKEISWTQPTKISVSVPVGSPSSHDVPGNLSPAARFNCTNPW